MEASVGQDDVGKKPELGARRNIQFSRQRVFRSRERVSRSIATALSSFPEAPGAPIREQCLPHNPHNPTPMYERSLP